MTHRISNLKKASSMLDDCASFPIIALCLSYNKCRATKNLSEQMFANILHSRAKSSIFKTNKRSKNENGGRTYEY